ncbi:MAG: NAD-dependent epimerase/dehydratase family protein [Mariniblastus sp.]
MRRSLVTGATGFIGNRLVRHLIERGDDVTCLARPTSDVSKLQKLRCRIAYADLQENHPDVASAIAACDTVYHLAAATRAVNSSDLIETNLRGIRTVLDSCASADTHPTLIYISSIAALGPNADGTPHTESAKCMPVSFYGRSKLACENLAKKYSNRVPISIVRPPIVLGQGDLHGLELFQIISNIGWHFVPTFSTYDFSVIHVDDLANAITLVAEHGNRLATENSESKNKSSSIETGQGVYNASTDTMTYSILGRTIGEALGRKRTRVLRVAKPCLWVVAAINELKGRIFSKPQYLNLDKYNEGTAGSWACSSEKLKTETGFAPAYTFVERLKQTIQWYRHEGLLNSPKQQTDSSLQPRQPAT